VSFGGFCFGFVLLTLSVRDFLCFSLCGTDYGGTPKTEKARTEVLLHGLLNDVEALSGREARRMYFLVAFLFL
jgi:hypothetical protein